MLRLLLGNDPLFKVPQYQLVSPAEFLIYAVLGLIETREFSHLHSDHSLAVALERMGAASVDALPVVSRADVHKLEGIVALRDVLKLYGFAAQNADD